MKNTAKKLWGSLTSSKAWQNLAATRLGKIFATKEMILYIFFGVFTTGVNLAVYFVLTDLAKMYQPLAYTIAWVVGVAVAFFTNKKYVFESRAKKMKALLFEAGTFVGGRLLTYLVGLLLITVFVTNLHQSNLLWKLITNVIEIVGNWVISKFVTFKNKADAVPATEEKNK